MALPSDVSAPVAAPVALVTGAARGIGLATARALAASGHVVWMSGRSAETLAAAAADIPGARPLVFDVADPAAVRGAFAEIHKTSKRLDVLVNNAGVMRGAPIEMASAELIDATLATNLTGVLLCCQYATRLMARSGGGSIINVTSIIGRVGVAGQSAYAASKAGVIGATLALAKELAGRQIRVNAVAPGIIETDLIAGLPPEKRAATLAAVAMGRIGAAEDVAPLIAFLASDGARYITGQVIGVDGGLVM